ncbi:MAG: hypothetical protein ABR923_18535 [Terracidiphilus sp.]|jgi:hypothetical protein
MKAPRSQKRPKNRQDFSVAPAGFFSVLKTAPRTVIVRPPGGYRSLVNPSSAPETSAETQEQLSARLHTTRIPLIGETGMMDRGMVRMAMIVAAAASFTGLILWWMMGFRH